MTAVAAKKAGKRAPAAKQAAAKQAAAKKPATARAGNGADVQREVEALLFRQSEALDKLRARLLRRGLDRDALL